MPNKKTYEELEAYIRELEKQISHKQNREYKSRLFSFIFGREENKKWTLSLYNAIHGTSYGDLSCITINTIEDVVYMGMKNDLSILASDAISLYTSMELYEQQSSFNPNIPVRGFMYAGKLYDKFIHSARLNQYGRTLLPLPLPKLIVFYNGEEEKEDETILRLSDAFKKEIRNNIMRRHNQNKNAPDEAAISAEVERAFQEASPDIEVKVRMVNINYGHSKEILKACKPLGEYSWFVAQVRKNLAGCEKVGVNHALDGAIDQAINEMPDSFELKKFITANRAEVKDMCLTEYNEAETMAMLQKESREEGWRKGWQKGIGTGQVYGIIKSGRRHSFSDDVILMDIMEETGYSYTQAKEALMDFDNAFTPETV